jgi:uncharacterized membrane protein YesL
LVLFTAGILVLPLYIGVVMIIAFFENDQYKLMFKVVRENFKPLLWLSVIELFLGLMALLATQMHDTGVLGIFNVIVLVVIISIMTLLIIYPPMILIKMRVSFKELIRNTVYLSLVDIKQTLLMFALTGIMIYMSIYAIWGLLLVVPYLQSISFISNQVLTNEKDKREKGEKK